MTIKQALQEATGKLKNSKIKSASLDAEVLLCHALKKPREFVLSHPKKELTEIQTKNYKLKTTRRADGEPVAYIIDHKEFYGLDFKVNKNVLIPRPETEHLVDAVISELLSTGRQYFKLEDKKKKFTIVDAGTGSGNIIISIAKELIKSELPTANYQLLAIDKSKKALRVAKQNAKKHSVFSKIKFIKGDLLNPILNTKYQMLDTKLVVVANLPYVSEELYQKHKTGLKYEPKAALISQNNGLAHYNKLFQQIKLLCDTCYVARVFLEFSPEQKNELKKMSEEIFPNAKIIFKKDLAKKFRVAILTF